MQDHTILVTPQSYRQPLDVVGVRITVLASSEATHGYEITIQEGPEGTGPTRHTHPWDESFYVLRGTVELDHAGELVTAQAGAFAHFPAGTQHGFRFGPGGGAMLEISGPNGLATRMFEHLAKIKPLGPEELPRLREAFGLQFILPG